MFFLRKEITLKPSNESNGNIKENIYPNQLCFPRYLEHFATLRQIVTIVFINEDTSERETIEKAIIVDLSGGRNGEFTHIKYAEGEKVIQMTI